MEAKRYMDVDTGLDASSAFLLMEPAYVNWHELMQTKVLSEGVYLNEAATVKPARITYGPERKGCGGKVKKW